MEEEAPSRRSVAELAGRFKGSSRPHDAAGNETQEKPVRRRPPRSLQLHKTTGDDQEPTGVTSPLPAKAKRNSALIEKLQSPGFKLLPPVFAPPSPGSAPVFGGFSSTPPASPLNTTSPWTEEEGPASFEAPPTVEEGSILSNTSIKGRARHSIRRRPPSRRHRTSSSGDEVGVAIEGEEATAAEDKTTTTTTGGETDEGKEDKTHEEDESEINNETRGDDEKERSKREGSSSGRKEEEENSEEKQTEDSTEGKTNTKSADEEKKEETTSQSSAR